LLADENFDAVITDPGMSGKEGIELIAALKRRRPQLPIIATSGDGPKCLRIAAARGADAVLEKPYDAADLIAALKRLTGISDAAG
jgi:CheY-like chemotaxis protein